MSDHDTEDDPRRLAARIRGDHQVLDHAERADDVLDDAPDDDDPRRLAALIRRTR